MNELDGGTIVCATRGGEGSRAVQMAAIQQAKTSGNNLVFLYITDPKSLGEYDTSLTDSISRELDWMGETLLRTAQRRADAAELVSEVRIRQGKIQEEICRFLAESKAGLLLLGAPRGTTANVFGDDAVEQFAQEIMDTTDVKVQIIRPENFEL
jgi:nucleotide-binding universal stress UspA family protein